MWFRRIQGEGKEDTSMWRRRIQGEGEYTHVVQMDTVKRKEKKQICGSE